MRLRYIFEISWRNLMERKIRSFVTISGVIIGITTIVFLTSLGYGIEKLTTSQIANEDSLSVFDTNIDESDIMLVTDEDVAKMRNMNNVAQVEPAVKLGGRISTGLIKTDVIIRGYSENYNNLSQFSLIRGQRFSKNEKDHILVSTACLKLINIQPDNFSDVQFSVEAIADQIISSELKENEVIQLGKFYVSGIIDDDTSPYVIMPLDAIKEDLRITAYNEMKIKVEDKLKISETRSVIEKLGFPTTYLGDTIKQINSIFVIFRYVIGGFGLTAMFVAVLGMFNTLTVSLLERITEIGVLKANNAMRKDIFLIFLSEALLISFVGSVFGVISGILSGKLVNFWFNFYALKNGSTALELFYVPPVFIIGVVVLVTFVGLLTGLYPASRASKIKILDALKYE